MLPEDSEATHLWFAISRRNEWRLKQYDYVVTYITHFRGAVRNNTVSRVGKNMKTVIVIQSGPPV